MVSFSRVVKEEVVNETERCCPPVQPIPIIKCILPSFYIEELRHLTGNDQAVYDYVIDKEETKVFIEKMTVEKSIFQMKSCPVWKRL